MESLHVALGFPDAQPEEGDLILRSVPESPADYTVCRNPGPAQIRCSAYATALRAAKRWARHQHIDVWFTDDDRTFVLLSRQRPDGSIHLRTTLPEWRR